MRRERRFGESVLRWASRRSNADHSSRLVRPEPGRKYFNHMARHSRGEWHRNWLLTSGQYIKTSDPEMRKGYGWKMVGESGPELVKLQGVGTS